MIDDDHNVFAFYISKIFVEKQYHYEVDKNVDSSTFRHRKRLELLVIMILKIFDFHANVTIVNIFFNVLRHIDLKITANKNFVIFCSIRMICKRRIINKFN